jgi:hypothetical protein
MHVTVLGSSSLVCKKISFRKRWTPFVTSYCAQSPRDAGGTQDIDRQCAKRFSGTPHSSKVSSCWRATTIWPDMYYVTMSISLRKQWGLLMPASVASAWEMSGHFPVNSGYLWLTKALVNLDVSLFNIRRGVCPFCARFKPTAICLGRSFTLGTISFAGLWHLKSAGASSSWPMDDIQLQALHRWIIKCRV